MDNVYKTLYSKGICGNSWRKFKIKTSRQEVAVMLSIKVVNN